MDRGAWQTTVHGVAKSHWTEEPGRLYSSQGRQDSDKTEQLHFTSNINPFDPHNISI